MVDACARKLKSLATPHIEACSDMVAVLAPKLLRAIDCHMPPPITRTDEPVGSTILRFYDFN